MFNVNEDTVTAIQLLVNVALKCHNGKCIINTALKFFVKKKLQY